MKFKFYLVNLSSSAAASDRTAALSETSFKKKLDMEMMVSELSKRFFGEERFGFRDNNFCGCFKPNPVQISLIQGKNHASNRETMVKMTPKVRVKANGILV